MAKPRAGFSARPVAAAAARAPTASVAELRVSCTLSEPTGFWGWLRHCTASDPNLPAPTPTSIPRADLSSTGAASANRSCVGSSSSTTTSDIAFIVMEICKLLSYDDEDDGGSAFPTAASGMKQQMELVPEDLAPLLDLPDLDDASSTTFLSASAAADTTNASADSTVTQVAAPADSTTAAAAGAEGPVLTGMELVLAELHGARGLTPRSKRVLAALAETASAELSHNPTAAALRTRRADFWRKVRVGILAATVFSVAAMDVALAFVLYDARRSNALYSNVLTPT